jgi:hypothetical protein
MRRIFEPEEKAWMRKVSTDLALWRTDGGNTPAFMSAVVSSWLKAFPYRHPRLARHHPYTTEQRELTLYGPSFYTISEVHRKVHTALSLIDIRKT